MQVHIFHRSHIWCEISHCAIVYADSTSKTQKSREIQHPLAGAYRGRSGFEGSAGPLVSSYQVLSQIQKCEMFRDNSAEHTIEASSSFYSSVSALALSPASPPMVRRPQLRMSRRSAPPRPAPGVPVLRRSMPCSLTSSVQAPRAWKSSACRRTSPARVRRSPSLLSVILAC